MNKKNNIKLLFEIYITFFKLGCFSFGGGYAMIPLIEREIAEEKKWIEREKLVDIFAVSESLPGAIALNSSAIVAYSIAGVRGATAALLGNLTPPFFIILTLSILFGIFYDNSTVQSAFSGIRPAVIGLIYYAAYKIGKMALKDNFCNLIMLGSFMALLFFHEHLHPVLVIVSGAILGILISCFSRKRNKQKDCAERGE